MITNNLFIIINETTFSGQNFSFTLIANNMYGNTTLYNNFISRFCVFNVLSFSLFIAVTVSDFCSNSTANTDKGFDTVILTAMVSCVTICGFIIFVACFAIFICLVKYKSL